MTAQQFESVARRAETAAASVGALAQRLQKLGAQASGAIGGSASGDDRAMLDLAADAATRCRQAAQAYTQAAQAARRAAAEAAQREAAQKKSTAKRR